MGFLDHSTNNIIIDAVLTDRGRKLLALNDGSFKIVHYCFGDDEVDYTIIKKFGRTVGKEKIEKNTPVFEASTRGEGALKYKLLSYSDPTLTVQPYLLLASDLGNVTRNQSTGIQRVIIDQKTDTSGLTSTQTSLLQESSFQVHVDSRFLGLQGNSSGRTIPGSTTAIYEVAASPGSGSTLSTITFSLVAIASGNSLTQYQDSNSQVRTVLRVIGTTTGTIYTTTVTVDYSA